MDLFRQRFVRVLRLLGYLLSGPRYNASELASEFQVSRRTIFRDIELLREAQIPIVFHEKSGGYMVLPSFQLAQPLPLSELDAALFFLAGHLSVIQRVPGLSLRIHEALNRVLGFFPTQIREPINNVLRAC